jgi:hypothetical protein
MYNSVLYCTLPVRKVYYLTSFHLSFKKRNHNPFYFYPLRVALSNIVLFINFTACKGDNKTGLITYPGRGRSGGKGRRKERGREGRKGK